MSTAIASMLVLLILRVLLSFFTVNLVILNYGNQAFISYGNIQSLGQIMQLLGAFGQNTALLRKNNNTSKRFFINLKRSIRSVIFFLPISGFISYFIVAFNPVIDENLRLANIFLIPGFFLSTLLVTLLISSLSSVGRSSSGQIISLVVGFIFLVLVYIGPNIGIGEKDIISIYMSSWILVSIFCLLIACAYFSKPVISLFIKTSFYKGITRSRVYEGLILMLMPAASILAIYIIRLILSEHLIVDQVAQWQIAVMISGLVSFFAGTLMGHIFIPTYVSTNMKVSLVRKSMLIIFLTIFILAPTVIYTKAVVTILFPSVQNPHILFFQIWLIAEWIRVLNWILSSTLIANKKDNAVLCLDWGINITYVAVLFLAAQSLTLLSISIIYVALCLCSFIINITLSKIYKLV